jgi:hypothetical protein
MTAFVNPVISERARHLSDCPERCTGSCYAGVYIKCERGYRLITGWITDVIDAIVVSTAQRRISRSKRSSSSRDIKLPRCFRGRVLDGAIDWRWRSLQRLLPRHQERLGSLERLRLSRQPLRELIGDRAANFKRFVYVLQYFTQYHAIRASNDLAHFLAAGVVRKASSSRRGTTPLRPVVVLHLGVRNSLHRLRRFPIPQRAPVVNCDTRSFDHSAKPCEAAPRQACAAGTVLPARSKRLPMDALSDVLRAVRLTDRAPSDVSLATITIEGCISSEGSNERRRIRTPGAPVSLRATSRSHS